MLHFFIRRPIFTSVCAIIIMLVGLVFIPTLPVELYPNIAPPQIVVNATYTGANAQVVESSVTQPLEREINGVKNMDYIKSTSADNGTSTITIVFKQGTDIDQAAVDVQNRINAAEGRLPAEVRNVGIQVTKSAAILMAGALYSENGAYDELFISNYADRYIKDVLKRVDGVGNVQLIGERRFSMRLWLDPNRLAMRGLSTQDVAQALRSQNIQIAAGQVGQPPSDPSRVTQFTLNARGLLKDATEFENIVLKRNASGTALVKLRDIGRVELGAEDYSAIFHYNSHPGVGILVSPVNGANALAVSTGVTREMNRLAEKFPPGLKTTMAFDATSIVGHTVNEVVLTLGITILLVIAIILLFLKRVRTTLIPAIAIPVSLIGTFAFIKLFGFSINALTLFGIILATGLVVDDAIVVIENIARYVEERKISAMQAAPLAMKEVVSAVIASSLVLVAVFIPVMFFPGSTGVFYRQFSLTIAVSILISLFVALTLTPMLSARLMSTGHTDQDNRFFRAVEGVLDLIRRTYQRTLVSVLRYKPWVLAFFGLSLASVVVLFKIIPSGFVPNEDQGYFIVDIQAPVGASAEYTSRIVTKAARIIQEDPDVLGTFEVAGFSLSAPSPNRGAIFPTLKGYEERKGHEHTVNAIVARLQPKLMSIPEATVIPFTPPPVQGYGDYGDVQFEFLDKSGTLTFDDMAKAANSIMFQANQRPEMVAVFANFTPNSPIVDIDIQRDKAEALGVPVDRIADTLQTYLGSNYVNDFNYMNRVYRVYLQADQPFRREPGDIHNLQVKSLNNKLIPMENLVKVTQTSAPQQIFHYNLFRNIEIAGSSRAGYSTGQAMDALLKIAKPVMPNGSDYEWAGISKEVLESGSQVLLIFGLGFLLVFLILAAQYESVWDPFIIMLAVPLAVLGAALAQWLAGQQNDIFFQIGLVMLIGLSSKNAILIVEFANQLRQQGMTLQDAVVEAAQIRLRPILMTSLAFIIGILPLMLSEGAGSGSRHSLSIGVFGGMVFSTVFSLYVIPVFYILVNQTHQRLGRWLRGKDDLMTATHSV